MPDKINPVDALAYKGYYFIRNDCNHNNDSSLAHSKNKMLQLKPEFAKNVQFSVANILHDYRKIPSKNSVVFARNFWPYLEPYQIYDLVNNLGKHLKTNSLLIFGAFDIDTCKRWKNVDMDELLNLANFKRTKIPNVFEKIRGVYI